MVKAMNDSYFKPHEYSTTRKDGRPISKKQARIKYGRILKKSIDISKQQALRFGFAQLVITGIGMGAAIATNNTDLALLVNGISCPFLFTEAYQMYKASINSKKMLEQLKKGELDPYEELKRIEQYFEEKSNDGRNR